jgi:CheY-like chemotaxis protein
MVSESPAVTGHRLIPALIRPGRPETIKTVLIIDDEGSILRAVKRVLSKLSVDSLAVDPDQPIKAQVLDLLSKTNVDLIIMDGLMPGLKGADLAKEIRAGGFSGYIAANSSMPDEQTNMLNSGADFTIPDKLNIAGYKSIFTE